MRVEIEDDRGVVLAHIEDAELVPRVGDHLQARDDVYVVSAVIWDLVDGPLVSVRLIAQRADAG